MAMDNLKSSFKVPDGRYVLHSAKTVGLVPFAMRRATRLTIATLHGGEEEGMYMVYNVGDYLHVSPFDATEKEPLCSLIFNPSAVRDGFPCCHAYASAKDGCDLIVGIANGEVMLMSLRAQLQAPQGNSRPIIAAQLNTDNVHDGSRVNVLLWVPGSRGGQFLAGHASGNIIVYKKTPAMTGESSGKLLSHLSSKSSGSNPLQTLHVPCGGIQDAAFSPDGSRLAVANRDGSVRLLEWPSGACVGGYRSYYGAALCVCWSPDAAYVASGGEDDLVAVYSVAERQVVAFGEGHASWVSRVAFDPWSCGDTTSSAVGPPGSPAAHQLREKLYRLGSVGQDTQACLFDLVIEEEVPTGDAAAAAGAAAGGAGAGGAGGSGSGSGAGGGGLKRVGSQSHINIPTVSSSANLAATQQQQQQQLHHQLQQQQEQPYQQYQQYQQQQQHQHHTGTDATPGHSRSTSDGALAGFAAIAGSRSGSGNLLSLLGKQQPQQPHQSLGGSGIGGAAGGGAAGGGGAGGGALQQMAAVAPVAPSVPRAEMTLLPPAMQQRIHQEPVTDIIFTEEAIFTACSSGSIKCWLRPHVAEEMAAQLQQQQQQQLQQGLLAPS